MALLFVWSITTPCSDTQKAGAQTTTQTPLSPAHEQNSSPRHSDACGPFCICACCSLNVHFRFCSPELANAPRPSDERSSFYLFPAPDDISLPVWQPPKLKA